MKTNFAHGFQRQLIFDLLIAGLLLTFILFFFHYEKKSDLSWGHGFPEAAVHSSLPIEMTNDALTKQLLPDHLPGPELEAPNHTAAHFSSIAPLPPLVPPIPSLAPQFNYEYVLAGKEMQINTMKNCTIRIPANAFVDQNGKPVQGYVELTYREFNNQWDMFTAGIPMHYDSSGYNLLESAGMLELNAKQNGKQVFINPDAPLNVTLSNVNNTDGYNVYYYDSAANKWNYQRPFLLAAGPPENDDGLIPDEETVKVSTAISGRIVRKSSMKPFRSYFLGRKKTPEQFVFVISPAYSTPYECNSLKKINWAYHSEDADSISSILFNKYPADYRNASVSVKQLNIMKAADYKGYILSFVADNISYRLAIEPFIENEKDLVDFGNAYDDFLFSRIAYEKKFESRKALKLTRMESKLVRTFQVNNFGMWNIDKPIRVDLPLQVNAKFQDEAGNDILINNGYMVLMNRNSILNINTFFNFSFNPATKNIFWAVLKGNKIGIVYPEQFQRYKDGKAVNAVFVMKVYDGMENAQYALKKAIES